MKSFFEYTCHCDFNLFLPGQVLDWTIHIARNLCEISCKMLRLHSARNLQFHEINLCSDFYKDLQNHSGVRVHLVWFGMKIWQRNWISSLRIEGNWRSYDTATVLDLAVWCRVQIQTLTLQFTPVVYQQTSPQIRHILFQIEMNSQEPKENMPSEQFLLTWISILIFLLLRVSLVDIWKPFFLSH